MSYLSLRIDTTGIPRVDIKKTKHGGVDFLAKKSLTNGIINFQKKLKNVIVVVTLEILFSHEYL